MTAAVYRTSQASLSIPHTQNTAPVLEFNCLYTHDIRRKQKRWQDGFLRFHTFNKRVMVYDVPRNFIGDTHWKADEAVQDGDEVTLEKDGVLVQVAESVGRTETDLTELRKSKNKGSSEHGSSPSKGGHTPAPRRAAGVAQKPGTQLKHRSLNALLGTPKGPLGKAALPAKSPYEERHGDAENVEWEVGRPPKRQRIGQPPAWNVTRTTETPAPARREDTPLWARTADAAKERKHEKKALLSTGEQRLGTKEVIELSDDEEPQGKSLPGFSSDALAPLSSPAKNHLTSREQRNKTLVRSSSPAFQTQKAAPQRDATKKRQVSRSDAAHRPAHPSRGGTETAIGVPVHEARIAKDAVSDNDGRRNREDPGRTFLEKTQTAQADPNKKGQTLRMTARSSKKTLLCQDQMSRTPGRTFSTNTENAIGTLLEAASEPKPPSEPAPYSQRALLEERLAKIGRKSTSVAKGPSPHVNQPAAAGSVVLQRERGRIKAPKGMSAALEGSETTLAQLDQMIMPVETRRVSPKALPVVAIPPKQDRQLRKVVSELDSPSPQKSAPGAPMRFSPSPSKRAPGPAAPAAGANQARRQTGAMPPKSRAKKPIQRSVSLNTAAGGTSAVIFRKPFQTPKGPSSKVAEPQEVPDPWSREAFDLFSWRPPGWNEESWGVESAPAGEGKG